jgi:hypothetical protein
MSAPYITTLPDVFPWRIRVSLDQLPSLVSMLSFPRQDAPNGSSFAVTSDAPSGYRFVWLSEMSYHTFADTFGQIINEYSGGVRDMRAK